MPIIWNFNPVRILENCSGLFERDLVFLFIGCGFDWVPLKIRHSLIVPYWWPIVITVHRHVYGP